MMKLTPFEQEIYALFDKRETLNTKEVAALTGRKHPTNVLKQLEGLADLGLVDRVSKGKPGKPAVYRKVVEA